MLILGQASGIGQLLSGILCIILGIVSFPMLKPLRKKPFF
ncbi:hypothetical protein EMIT079MI2_430003 [Bacillus sp. IT-79MI2]